MSKVKLAKGKAMKKVVEKAVVKAERKIHAKPNKPKQQKSQKPKAVISSSMRSQRVVSAPASLGASTRSYFQVRNLTSGKYKGGVRITGRDYFGSATFSTSAAAGSSLLNSPVNPSALVGTRLAEFTKLYEKYRFNKFKIYAMPTAASSTAGAYGMSYDRDPSDVTPATGDPGIREYMSFEGSVTASAWLPSELDCPLMEPTTDYFVNAVSGGDERLVDQGQVYLWVYTPVSTNITIALEIEYDLTLYVPQTTGTVGAVQFVATTTSGSQRIPPDSNGSGGGKAWNAFNTSASSPSGNWGTKTTVGDIAKFVGISSSTAGFAIQVAGGLYSLYQGINGLFSSISLPVGTYGFGNPTFVANRSEEQSLFTVDSLVWFPGTVQGRATAEVVNSFSIDNLYVPPGGGVLYGNFDDSSIGAYDTATLASGTVLTILLAPAAVDCSPTNLFSPMLGKPGKFGDEHRRKWAQYLSTRKTKQVPQCIREFLEKLGGQDQIPALMPASSVPPQDNPDARRKEQQDQDREVALQIAKRLLQNRQPQ